MRTIFYRNIRARDQLELFLLAAISSVLLVRLYLHLTGYPQIGSGGLHIAHMLWGGALMMAGIVIGISFLGARALRIMAIVGGIGFGVFIDEIGKFITRDNNYFYEPAIGIIYAIFIILYLSFNFLSRTRPMTAREYQLNALAQLEEAIVHDMNPVEKAEVGELLERADQSDPLTNRLKTFLAGVQTIPVGNPHRLRRFANRISHRYQLFWHRRQSNRLIQGFFIVEALLFVAGVVSVLYSNVSSIFDLFNGTVSYSVELAIGQLVASCVAACFAVYGAIILPKSRLKAYEQFRRATLVNIFLTQCFAFARVEFEALPGFFFNLLLLGIIGYAIRQEQKLRKAPAAALQPASSRPKKLV
jgi:hypothetical protein